MSSTASTAIQNIRLGSQAAVVSHTGLGRLSMSVDGGLGNNRIYALRPQQTRCLFIAFDEGTACSDGGSAGDPILSSPLSSRGRRSLPFRPLSLMWRF